MLARGWKGKLVKGEALCPQQEWFSTPSLKLCRQNLSTCGFLLKNRARWAVKNFNLVIHSKGREITRTWEGAQQGIAIKNPLPTVSRFLAPCPWWLNQAAAGKYLYTCECALLEARLSRNLATIVYAYPLSHLVRTNGMDEEHTNKKEIS